MADANDMDHESICSLWKRGTHVLNVGRGCAKRSTSATVVKNGTPLGHKLERERKVIPTRRIYLPIRKKMTLAKVSARIGVTLPVVFLLIFACK